MPPKKVAQPIIYQKLTQLLDHPGIFNETRYENDNGVHRVFGVINDKYFEEEDDSEKTAKDKFALQVFKTYHTTKPVKTKAQEKIAQHQLLCWSPNNALIRFRRNCKFEYVETDEDGIVNVKLMCSERTRNHETKKWEYDAVELAIGFGESSYDAEFDLSCVLLNSDEYRNQYIEWVKNGKKGWWKAGKPELKSEEPVKLVENGDEMEDEPFFGGEDAKDAENMEDVENQTAVADANAAQAEAAEAVKTEEPVKTEETSDEPKAYVFSARSKSKKEWDKCEDLEKGEWMQKLTEFCIKYDLPEPDYFMAPESHMGPMKVLCKIAIHAKDQNKEEACLQINTILLKICTERQAVHDQNALLRKEQRLVEQAAKKEQMEADRVALKEKLEVERLSRVGRLQIAKAEMEAKREAKKAELGLKQVEQAKEQANAVIGIEDFDQAGLKAKYGEENLEQFPLLKVNEYAKKEFPVVGVSVEFTYVGGSPQEGFKTIASLAGVSVVGKGVGSKDSKQVAAQALLMAFRNGGAVGKLSEEQQANLTKMKNFDFSKAAAPKVEEPASFEQTVVPDNFADKVAPVVAMSQAGINSVQYVSQAAQIFEQTIEWDTDGGMAAAANTKIFTTVCAFGHIEASGTGKNKKESKQRAADLIIPKIVAEFGDPITYKASKKSKK